MLLTNHTLTGIALGLAIDNPVVLAPAAVASHLALDMTPHFWFKRGGGNGFDDPLFLVVGAVDFGLSVCLAIGACLIWPGRALNVIVGVIGADLPDLIYIPVILVGRARLNHWLPWYEPMLKFLKRIQWSETPAGIITEIIWLAVILSVISKFLPR